MHIIFFAKLDKVSNYMLKTFTAYTRLIAFKGKCAEKSFTSVNRNTQISMQGKTAKKFSDYSFWMFQSFLVDTF